MTEYRDRRFIDDNAGWPSAVEAIEAEQDGDLDRAEAALVDALGRVRRRKQEGGR